MSPALREELTRWRFLDTWKDCIPWRDGKHLLLYMSSNSSGFAWGGVFHLPEGNLAVRVYWSSEEAALHISTKEMLALHGVLQSSPVELRNCRVDVNVDSQSLLDTWSREGSRSPQLTAATKDVFHLVSERNIQLTLHKVPSKANIADYPSRRLSPSDSMLSLRSWKRIQKAFGGEAGHTLHLMALDSSGQRGYDGSPLTHFTPFPTPQSAGVNLFAQNPMTWKRNENPYVFPPFNLIGPTLKFVLPTGISFSIVVPNLPFKPFWWPIVVSSASDQFVLCRKGDLHEVLYPQKGGGFGPVPSPVELWVFRVHN